MAALPRMRNAEGVLRELKAADPDTRITAYFIRRLINSGAVPVVQIGRLKMVNVDHVFDYLATNGVTLPDKYAAREAVSG